MEKIKKILKKISKFFGWIIASIGLVALIVMKILSKQSSEINQKIDEKKTEINEKKEELKATEKELNQSTDSLDQKIDQSKKINSEISSDKEERDKQADKFFGAGN